MSRFLVTGATGFLGRQVVERLLARSDGSTLRVLCRTTGAWRNVPRVETVQADILDSAAVDNAVAGVDGIFHFAGLVTRDKGQASLLFDTHVRGTQNVCESALRHGSPRIILLSSSGTVAASKVPVIHNEDSPFSNELAAHWPYYLSKIYQEKTAIAFHATHGLPVIIASPSLLLGPGDDRLSSTGDVRMFLHRQIPNVPSGGLNFVDVRDTADTVIRAMESGVPGRRYLIGGHNMTVKDFFQLLERLSGIRSPRLELPESWSRTGAGFLRGLYRLAGRQYALDDTTVEMAYRFWYFDNSRARNELGLTPRPAEETLRDTIAYLKGSDPAS
jgi:dihydroflavonol-4-reductase